MAVDAPPSSLLDRLRETPSRAPEILALAATERLGPPAAEWARTHSGPQVAAEAVRRHVRLARAEGAATGAAGIFGIVPDLAALGWLQARMVLQVAAAHGFPATDPMRPAELLVLWEFSDTVEEARSALDHEGRHLGLSLAGKVRGRDKGVAARLAKIAGRRAAERFGARVVPGLGALVGSVQNATATKELGERALLFYGSD